MTQTNDGSRGECEEAMTDIVDSLRKSAAEPNRNSQGWYSCGCGEELEEAADEIERLERELLALGRGGAHFANKPPQR